MKRHFSPLQTYTISVLIIIAFILVLLGIKHPVPVQEKTDDAAPTGIWVSFLAQEGRTNKFIIMNMGIETDHLLRAARGTGSLAWSPDGQYLASGCEDITKLCIHDRSLIPLDYSPWGFNRWQPWTGNREIIDLPDKCIENLHETGLSSISWSRNSDKLALVCSDFYQDETSTVCIYSRVKKEFHCWETRVEEDIYARAEWSPVDDTLVIDTGIPYYVIPLSTPPGITTMLLDRYIEIVDENGHTLKKLTVGWSPTWSPDGKQIAYATFDYENGYAGIAIYDLETKVSRWAYRPAYRGSKADEQGKKLHFEIPSGGVRTTKIVWVKDRNELIVATTIEAPIYNELYSVNINNYKVTNLTSNLLGNTIEPSVLYAEKQ